MPNINRRDCLKVLFASAATANAATLKARRPNIIVILTDDQGYADLGCHGNLHIKTPNMDRIHHEATRLTDHHVSPTCSPTRTALMTGRHEFRSGITHTILERERMSLKSVTIAQVLKKAGYTTGIFGKWHMGDAAPYQPGNRGFDEVFIHGCGGIGQHYPGTCSDAPGNKYFNPTILHNNVFEKTEGYCTDVFFGQSIKWMDKMRQSKTPFFTYITPNAPHAPLDCPENYVAMYKDKGLPENVQKFYGMITNIDDNIGRLLESLKTWEIERETLLIFMNDNGSATGSKVFNAGMRGQKGGPYEGGIRAAGFLRWPGTLAVQDVNHLTAHIDLFPTLTEIAGAKLPAGVKLDGRNLLPILENPKAAWADRYLFSHVGRWAKGGAADAKYSKCRVRSTQYSMVNQGEGEAAWELYDMKADPGETKNLSTQLPAMVKKMSAVYDKWWNEVLPALENENAEPPKVAPYLELYQKQFGK